LLGQACRLDARSAGQTVATPIAAQAQGTQIGVIIAATINDRRQMVDVRRVRLIGGGRQADTAELTLPRISGENALARYLIA
jgi:hypothetical protein